MREVIAGSDKHMAQRANFDRQLWASSPEQEEAFDAMQGHTPGPRWRCESRVLTLGQGQGLLLDAGGVRTRGRAGGGTGGGQVGHAGADWGQQHLIAIGLR